MSYEQLSKKAFPNVVNIESKATAIRKIVDGTTKTPRPTTYRPVLTALGVSDEDVKAAESGNAAPKIAPATTKATSIVVGLPRGDEIIGREEDLAWLHDALAHGGNVQLTNSGAILSGQGGIGKTSLARAYAECHRGSYDAILWIEADSRQKIIEGLMDLCPGLGVSRPDLPTLGHAKDLLVKLQGSDKDWLFIYDNVETRADFYDLIPQAALIVTTRQGEGWAGFKTRATDVLDFATETGAAVQLLMREAERTDDASGARALAETLGGLPLALVIAGRMIAKDGGAFADYQSQVARIIAREPKNDNYPDLVIGAVKLSYDKLPPDAQMVADLFAWWAPEGVEARLLTDAPGGAFWEHFKDDIPEVVQELAQAPGRVAAAVEALEDRSLLRRGAAGYDLHRMTAAALRAMQSEAPLNGAAAALLAAVYPEPNHSGNWPECRRLTPHLRRLWASGSAPEIAAMDFLLNQASVFLGMTGDVTGNVEMARAALASKEARLPESDRGIAVGHATLGWSLLQLGDLAGAEASLRRAVALHGEHRPDSELLAGAHDLLGAVLLQKGRAGDRAALGLALREYQKSAAILRRHVPRLSAARAQALNNLGTVRDALGQGAAALRLYEYSLAIRRQVLPDGDARLGYGVMNTGAMALKSGAADRAEGLLTEALALRRSVYLEAPKHPEIVTTAGWLVSCLLTRARAGEDAAARTAQARALCDEFGWTFDQREELARQYPYRGV